MGELLAHGFHASPGKLHSRNWVTYIVSGGPGRERHSTNIDRFISSDVPASFFNPFARGSLLGSQVAPPSSPTEGRSVEHLSNFQSRPAPSGYRWLR